MPGGNGGFKAMSPEALSKIAALGGREAHRQGRGNEFNSATARAAGLKSAQVRAAKRKAQMSESIKPTIGRKVWLWTPATVNVQDPLQAFDASICFVHPDDKVNITYVNHWGTIASLSQVELRDPADSDRHGAEAQPYCTWMPYQVNQARKEAMRENWNQAVAESTPKG